MSLRMDTSSLRAWRTSRVWLRDVSGALGRLLKGVPRQWHPYMTGLGRVDQDKPAWLACLEAVEGIDKFSDLHGSAEVWNLRDDEVCAMAQTMADQCAELDDLMASGGQSVNARLDACLMVARMSGVDAPLRVFGEGAIMRLRCDRWWRRVLRVHVARVVEAGAVKLGVVNKRGGGYASNSAVERRRAQLARNAESLKKSIYRNEAGQVWSLAELAALSTSNPVIRGGELMTRIRGAEEYASEAGHIGLFITLTCPSAFHPVTVGSGGRPRKNPRYDGITTPREAQMWLRKMWARVRAELARRSIKMYGIRVAEPHHDATPHWHMLVWLSGNEAAVEVEQVVRHHWLSQYGDERGAAANRINIKRMHQGGAAGYVAKYVAKSIGHHALADHVDVAQGQLFDVSTGDVPGHVRVDAWASTWAIRQFQSFGMPAVGLWRLMRRVSIDQAESARLRADWSTWKAWFASHKHGEDIPASFCAFVRAVGGMCLGRGDALLRVCKRDDERLNSYGETVKNGVVFGLRSKAGSWLITKRQGWSRVEGAGVVVEEDKDSRAAKSAPWTGFNNCTARLSSELWPLMFGMAGAASGRFPAYRSWTGTGGF